MFARVVEASSSYFKQIYENRPTDISSFDSEDFYVSKIEAFNDSIKKEIYLFLDENLVKDIYMFMIGEESQNEDELKDFTCEIANMIVGSAKVLAQDDKDRFNISTPVFVSHANDVASSDYDKSANFDIEDKKFSIRARYL